MSGWSNASHVNRRSGVRAGSRGSQYFRANVQNIPYCTRCSDYIPTMFEPCSEHVLNPFSFHYQHIFPTRKYSIYWSISRSIATSNSFLMPHLTRNAPRLLRTVKAQPHATNEDHEEIPARELTLNNMRTEPAFDADPLSDSDESLLDPPQVPRPVSPMLNTTKPQVHSTLPKANQSRGVKKNKTIIPPRRGAYKSGKDAQTEIDSYDMEEAAKAKRNFNEKYQSEKERETRLQGLVWFVLWVLPCVLILLSIHGSKESSNPSKCNSKMMQISD